MKISSLRFIFALEFLLFVCFSNLEAKPLSMIIMGYGGRAQWLLMKCLEQRSDIVLVAICDDQAGACLDHMKRECEGYYHNLKKPYEAAVAKVQLYPDSPAGIREMLEKHHDVDMIWITSRNDRHWTHLTEALKYPDAPKIFMEKPLFRTLDEFRSFNWELANGRDMVIGLTLRYSSMAVTVAEQLQSHREQLGALRKVKAWERLSFDHALGSFVLGTRRYRSLWGGLLLEKSIHDIDLALFFISATGFYPSRIRLNTTAENRFFTRSNLPQILAFYGDDSESKKRVSEHFTSYPLNGEFHGSDLIPDYHQFSSILFAEGHDPVEFEVETDMSAFRPVMERGTLLTFEHGQILVDVIASLMTITLNDGTHMTYDLQTLHGGHADGDIYVVHAILSTGMSKGHFQVSLSDKVVRLANIMALISEDQALHRFGGTQEIIYEDGTWGVLE